jgi:dipeptidase E
MKNMLIASTSTVYGGNYLDYLQDEIRELFRGRNEILFIPYARPGGITHDAYTNTAREFFSGIGLKVFGIHEFPDAVTAVRNAAGIFVGGGNSFLLLQQLYATKVLSEIKKAVEDGTPYMGTSAGSNVAGLTIRNTNDMPITEVSSFDAMGLYPFNLNPHYLDPVPELRHMGETRDTRLREYITINTIPCVGLREGSWLRFHGNELQLKGGLPARIYERGKQPREVYGEGDLQYLMS